ncbi:MAG: hypothetical protein U0271_45685 [Polyangiaceae bacterium]
MVERPEVVVALDEHPVLRNLLITQSYFELSSQLSELLGRERGSRAAPQMNWCTFATWASKTAGRFIRKEACPSLVARLLGVGDVELGAASSLPPESLALFAPPSSHVSLLGLPERILEEVSKLIARGNLLVYAEVAPMFSRVLRVYSGVTRPTDEHLLEVQSPLKVGDSAVGGQTLLREALAAYHQSILTDDPDARAELVLLGNLRVGLHEQTRLQPYIKGSLDAPVRRLLRSLLIGNLPSLIASTLEPALKRMGESAALAWRELATAEMMVLHLPTGDLRMGQGLKPQPGQPRYSAYLRTIENSELAAALAALDAADTHTSDQGVTDWSFLPERMRYICELFRSRQSDAALLAPPFSEAQQRSILDGAAPHGAL